MADTEAEASYIDYEAFASPDFHAPSFANTLVLSTNDANDTSLDLSTPLSRVLFDVQEVDTHIDSLTTSSALPLLKHTSTRAKASTHVLDTLESQVQGLQQAYTRLHQDVVERYEQAEQVRLTADRLATTLRLARAVARCLQIGRTLEGSIADTDKPREGYRTLAPAARLVLSLRQALSPDDIAEARLLARVNVITTLRIELLDPSERSLLAKAQQSVPTKAKKQPTTRKTAATKKPAIKKKIVNEDSIVNDEEDAFDPPIVAPKPKRKPRVSKKASIKDDESLLGDSDDTIGRSAAKSKRKSRKRASTGSGSEDVDEDDQKAVKPKHRIHVPTMVDLLTDTFADEEPPESSAPWSIRGPIWKKDVLAPKQPSMLPTPARQPSLLKSTLNHSALKHNNAAQNRTTPVRNPPAAVNSVSARQSVASESRPQDLAAMTPKTHSDAWGDLSDDIDSELLMGLVADQPQQINNVPKAQPFLEESSDDDFDTEDLIMLDANALRVKDGVPDKSPTRSPPPARTIPTKPPSPPPTTSPPVMDSADELYRSPTRSPPPAKLAVTKPLTSLRKTAPVPQTTAPQIVDFADELADLPSDAFDSDDQTPAKNLGGPICISSSPPKIAAAAPKPNLAPPRGGLVQKTLFGGTVVPMGPATQANKRHAWPLATQREPPTHHKLNEEATQTWVYPTNLGTTRDYQFNIVSRGLFHNLLVALPTGLGKTFIAATI
ncbi:P-loop containing nucleoside triphosphate hydrolase protein, partial [Aureobasidium melanogenum]